MPAALKRIHHELENFVKRPPDCGSAGPLADDPFHWQAALIAPQRSAYEGGVFFLDVRFPEDYPVRPPQVTFKTPIYHPNVSAEGEIGLELLHDNWTPALTLEKVLLSLSALLAEPEARDALRPELAAEFQQVRAQFEKKARAFTEAHAM